MPVTHQPAGSSAGGQFAPADSGSKSKGGKKKAPKKPTGLSPAAQKYLKAVAAATKQAGDKRLPDLSGVPKKDRAAVSKYLRAVQSSIKKKVRTNDSTIKKVKRKRASDAKRAETKARSAAKKSAVQKQRDRANAARAAAANRSDRLSRTNRG